MLDPEAGEATSQMPLLGYTPLSHAAAALVRSQSYQPTTSVYGILATGTGAEGGEGHAFVPSEVFHVALVVLTAPPPVPATQFWVISWAFTDPLLPAEPGLLRYSESLAPGCSLARVPGGSTPYHGIARLPGGKEGLPGGKAARLNFSNA